MAKQVGIAVIGCGYWGANYVRVFSELPDTRVVAVCDQRPERLIDIGQRYPGVALAQTVADALAMPGVDAAVVCTDASSHFHVARECLRAGKHTLVEKPIATRSADAAELMALAESRRLTLMVGHTFLYNAGVQRVKEYIDHGDVGRIYYLYARRTNLGPIRRDVNALWDLAPHDISIFNYFLGRAPLWVSAVGSRALRNGREDIGFIVLGYPDNVLAQIHVSWADPHKVREVVVVGSAKRIVFNDLQPMEQVRVFEKGVTALQDDGTAVSEPQLLMRDGDIISPSIQAKEPLRTLATHFSECVLQGGRPLTDGAAGRDVVRVLEAVDRSMAQRGAPVELTTEEAPLYVHYDESASRPIR
ncbi:MAG: Gfo/Idh/MocA family oxidoreductase [Sphaerobacter sp.]|nr:Gfo/Idh/MocA family oxidoreductase [Sphaerobacter sp.]